MRPGSGRPALAQRLRDETRADHERAEAALDWENRVATRAGYAHLLARLHGFHAGFEEAASALAEPDLIEPRRKAHLLRADLRALGWTAERVDALPVRRAALPGRAALFGAMYVLEGAHLGGQIIARHVAAGLGLTPETGLAFYTGYGARTGALWRGFQERLESEFGEAGDGVVAAAHATFEGMRLWLVPDEALAEPA
jgi:heme oxygenase (biliverdin-IX-beta and delta-forming)